MGSKRATVVEVRECPPDCHKVLRKGSIVEGVKLHYVFGLRELFDRLAADRFDRLVQDGIVAQAKGTDTKTGYVYKLEEWKDGKVMKFYMGFREPTEDELQERNAEALERFRQWKAQKSGQPVVEKQQTKQEGDHHGNEEKSGGQKRPEESKKPRVILGC